MSEGLAVEYKGETITYNEWAGKWSAVNGAISLPQLSDVKAKMDALDKAAFKRQKAWWLGYRDDPAIVDVTSQAEQDGTDKYPVFWISTKGKRSKTTAPYLFAVDAHNAAIIEEMGRLEAEADALNKRVGLLKPTLHPFTPETASGGEGCK